MSMRYYDIHTHTYKASKDFAVVSIAYNEATPALLDHTPYLSLSLHPWESHLAPLPIEQMLQLAAHPHVVAIGECGIDTMHSSTPLAIQERLFISQIELADRVQKPLIIHCVRAFDKILQLHKQFAPHQPWIVHGFRGKPTLAKQLQQQGIYLSIGAQFNPSTLAQLSPALTFVESDTSTIPLEHIYQQIALSLNIEVEQLLLQVAKNSTLLFGYIINVK